jgi:hypothetical protein
MARPRTTARTCRLTLTIDGQDYRLRRVDGSWRLRKAGTGDVHFVHQVIDGADCSCQDYVDRSHDCKYIRSMKAVGLIG